MAEKKNKFPSLIVGIGASAGGLAALKSFVKSVPRKTEMAYIIIQHLDPSHESMLSEILEKDSPIKVSEAKNNEIIDAGHIYVIPPDAHLEVSKNKIKLTRPPQARGARKTIDYFFRSLAAEYGDKCAGIVLSGSGSDGTAGLRAIQASGGLAIVQDPDSAEHESMPLSAMEAKVVDKVVAVEEMQDLLDQYASNPLSISDQDDSSNSTADESLEEISSILKTHEDFNLRQYKPTTVQRRIARRMGLIGSDTYKSYLDVLRKNQDERKLLTSDLMINVTDFFRDPEAFEILEKKVIPSILEQVKPTEDIRVWIPGCATGEEAYSIAILLLESLGKKRRRNHIKIFATDVDEHAISIARKGQYPESIAGEIPEKYLQKYFIKAENAPHYKVQNKVRDLISFAVQNIVSDPPFNHMHLISCRNLLIYLKKEMQEKALNSFYFALEDDAYLFLGSSETLGNRGEWFKTISKKWRFYKKIAGSDSKKALMGSLPPIYEARSPFKKRKNKETSEESRTLSRSDKMRRSILNAFLSPTVIVNEEGQILYNHGDWKKYMSIPTGEPSQFITQLVIPSLRSRLRSALYKVKKGKEPVTFRAPADNDDKETSQQSYVRVEISMLPDQDFTDGDAMGIVFFEEDDLSLSQKETVTDIDEHAARNNLEQELVETKQELQNTIEELETSSEELKASHEESLSTNEELQSANEELEASSEELRSLNEELSTVNAQLKEKIGQLQQAHDDVENFFESTDLPTIFLDTDLKIQRYTPAAELLLKVGPYDVERPISNIGRDLIDGTLCEECQQVLKTFQPVTKEVKSLDDRWFIRKVTPYRTEDLRVQGIVLVFQEITELKELTQRAEIRELQQAAVAKLGLLALSDIDFQGLMDQTVRQVAHVLNAEFCKVLQYQPKDDNFLLASGIGWQESLVGKATVPNDKTSQGGYTFLSKDAVIVQDLDSEMRFSAPELLQDHNIKSGISCPINHSNPSFGVLGVHSKSKRKFTKEDANFITSIANLLSSVEVEAAVPFLYRLLYSRLGYSRFFYYLK